MILTFQMRKPQGRNSKQIVHTHNWLFPEKETKPLPSVFLSIGTILFSRLNLPPVACRDGEQE